MNKSALREIRAEGWEKSVFCLIPQWDEWPYKDIKEPDETGIWPWDGRILCGWFYWSLLGDLPVSARTANYDGNFFPIPPEDEKEKDFLQ